MSEWVSEWVSQVISTRAGSSETEGLPSQHLWLLTLLTDSSRIGSSQIKSSLCHEDVEKTNPFVFQRILVYLCHTVRVKSSRIEWRFDLQETFLFSTASRPVPGPTQPPNQWVPGAFTPAVKRQRREADHSPPSSYASTSPYVFMA
jgi:hypothetical protein